MIVKVKKLILSAFIVLYVNVSFINASYICAFMKIGYIEYENKQHLGGAYQDEDTALLDFLRRKGLIIENCVWTDPGVQWNQYDLIILKSPWEYHEQIDRFFEWLHQLQKAGIPLLNPVETVKWNSHKFYLREIAAAGLPVIDTVFLEAGSQLQADHSYFDLLNANQLVIKPAISAGAANTFVLSGNEKDLTSINHLLAREPFLLQPFVAEIKQGEWSFLFFNGRYSHGVIKIPGENDFRVQQQHGGITRHDIKIEQHLIDQATTYVNRFASGTLYARVDGIVKDGTFYLMELELIEPYLFLNNELYRMENYYQALRHFIE